MKLSHLFIILLLLALYRTGLSQSLNLTQDSSWISIGDLDIQGNQITVEALVYRAGSNVSNIVSKHSFPDDVNYLLRAQTFELTTYVSGNSGPTQFLQMANPFTLDLNTWYHIAGTYNGQFVRYYVNGCLVIEKPFSGNLFQNDFTTAIGNQSSNESEQFYGRLDEVRIWNVCRTQEQITSSMLDLSNPSIQAGLLAYYKFDNDYENEQGNALLNGTPIGLTQFATSQIDLPSFEITSIETTNSTCNSLHNGSITISSNRPNSSYSVDGVNYQFSNFFPDLPGGTYTIYVKSPEGCIIDSIAIVIDEGVNYPVSITTAICEGTNYFGYTASGLYIDTIKFSGSCDTIRTLNLTVFPTYEFYEEITICPGEVHFFQGNTFTESGTYIAPYTTANGCDSTYTLALEVLPGTFLGNDTLICVGNEFEIVSPSPATVWFDNTTSKTKTVTATGWYWATLKDASGCDVVDSIFIQFNLKYYAPNAFTPDKNGLNDVFIPVFSDANLTGYNLRIFDRWGRMIFSADDPANSWDGTFDGKVCDIGTYIFFMTVATGICENTTIRGNISLIK